MKTQPPETPARERRRGRRSEERAGRRTLRRLVSLLLIGLLAALVLRAAAPGIVRRAIEHAASGAMAGRLEIGDLDLSLVDRTVHVRDVTLRDPAAPDSDPPVVSLRGASARFSLDSLRKRDVRIRELVLDTPRLDFDRLEDGRLNLAVLLGGPRADEAEPPAVPQGEPKAEPPPAPPAPPAWHVSLDHVRLAGGRIEFRDFAVAGSEVLDVEIETFEIDRLTSAPGGYAEPAQVRFAARAEDARVSVDAQIQPQSPGFVVQATLRGESLPLRQARVYLPEGALGEVEGRLDAQLVFDYASGKRSRLFGTASLRDLVLRAPGDPDPALRLQRLDAELRELDFDASRVTLDGATLVGPELTIVPEKPQPIPLLGIFPEREGRGTPWSWSLGRVDVRDGQLHFAPGPGRAATSLGVCGRVDALASAPGARANVEAEITSPPASARWSGTLSLDPLDPLGTIEVDGLEVGRALSLLPAERRPALPADLLPAQLAGGLRLEPGGRASGKLALRDGASRVEWEGAATREPFGVTGELRLVDVELRPLLAFVPPDALPVAFQVGGGRLGGALFFEAGAASDGGLSARGTLRVGDALLSAPDERGPSAGVSRARLELESLRVPRVFGEAGSPARAGPVEIALSMVHLSGPSVRLVRDGDGFVWPPPSPALREAQGAPPVEPGPQLVATGAASSEPVAPLRLRVARLEIDGGEVQLVDRGVSPWYQGRYTEVSLRAEDLGWPWSGVRALQGSARLTDGAPITVEGKGDASGTTLVVRGEKISLPPLNPYFTARGYSVGRGTLSLVSSVWIGPAGFEAKNWLVFHDLDLGGPSGDSLFRQEFGVSLSAALPLLRDLSGDISLEVPMWLDRKGFGVGVGDAIRSAIVQALTWALASPLKLLRAAWPSSGKASAPELAPIPFAPGAAVVDLAGGAAAPIDALSALVSSSPGLRPTLEGVVGERDERAMREAALLERLRGGVLGRVRQLTGVGTDARLRRFLAGETTDLSEEDRAELASRLAAIPVGEAELRALARAREEAIRDWLAAQHGVTDVELASGRAEARLARGEPSVRVGLGGRR